MGMFSKTQATSTSDVRQKLIDVAEELRNMVGEAEKTLLSNVETLRTRTQPPRTIEQIKRDEICHRCPLLKAYLKEHS